MSEVKIEEIGQIAVAISDLQRVIPFYRDVLGLKLLFEAPPGLAFFQCGGVRIMLTTLQGDEKDHHTSVIYYKVKDIDKTTTLIKGRGIVFIQEPQLTARMEDHELWMGFIRDPEENLIGIMCEKPLTN